MHSARSRWPPLALAAWCALFVVAAAANAGGYRYGASDQAFYAPAVLHHLDEALFPRDWPLLAAQDRLNLFTPLAAALARATGFSVPSIFAGLYLAGLVTLFAAAIALGRALSRSRWTPVALAFALTLRHAIAMGAVNTLEGYMHPRLIAFGFGGLAVAACLAARPGLAAGLALLAAACHPTTGLWFVVWTGVALAVSDRRFVRPIAGLAGFAVLAGAWAVLAGPLAGRLGVMDAEWLSVLTSKTYLFPDRWPVGGWLPALLTPLAAGILFEIRRRRGLAAAAERGVAAGAGVLVAIFLASIPLVAARLVLAVQLQVPRALWMVDLLAVAYFVWYVAEGIARNGRAARTAAVVFAALSLGRGAYVMLVEHPERPIARVGLPADGWTEAMRWIAGHTPKEAWVLAAPGHAWKYGTSVRVAAGRDVYLEEAKDAALAMYSREGAMRVLERIRGAAGFDALTSEAARALGPDVLVTEARMNLPLLHDNGRFRVYRLR
jgi:hypothetical protein